VEKAMPSKTKPRWGQVPPDLGAQELLTNEQALDLARHAKVLPERLNDFVEKVFDVVHAFTISQHRDESETPIAAQRAALEELKLLASRFFERLGQVDASTRRRIALCYPQNRLAHELDARPDLEQRRKQTGRPLLYDQAMHFRRDADHVRRVYDAVALALDGLKEDKGSKGGKPAKLRALQRAAVSLAAVWEQFTGTPFTAGAPYKGGSTAAAFVATALKWLMPDATEANIKTALREAASQKAREGRERKPL
jgi:hypothetical protein